MQHDMKSVLEEIDHSGRVLRSLVINEGSRFESGGRMISVASNDKLT
jgi:hypothetical protein